MKQSANTAFINWVRISIGKDPLPGTINQSAWQSVCWWDAWGPLRAHLAASRSKVRR